MTFETFERSPEVAPLLVKLYDTHKLYALAKDKNNNTAFGELTGIMTDLLSVKLSQKESELITDVLLTLMKQAQVDLKRALSERLAALDTVPLRMVLAIANDEITVAEPVLIHSKVLQDLDLMYIIQGKGVEHARFIAKRDGLSPSLINMLADTNDFQVAVNLAENDGAKLTDHAFNIFTQMAAVNEAIAKPLLSREDLPRDIIQKLYECVGAELKKAIAEKFGNESDIALIALEDIAVEIKSPVSDKIDPEMEQKMIYARNQLERGNLKFSDLFVTLRRGQRSTFLAQFAVLANISAGFAMNAIREQGGKSLATICRVLEVTKPDFVSLYLLTDRFRTTEKRVVNHAELTRVMTMFDEIDTAQARETLKNSRH